MVHRRETEPYILDSGCMCVWSLIYRTEWIEKQQRIHSECQPYSCDVCDKSLGLQYNLKLHITVHTGERVSCTVNIWRHIRVYIVGSVHIPVIRVVNLSARRVLWTHISVSCVIKRAPESSVKLYWHILSSPFILVCSSNIFFFQKTTLTKVYIVEIVYIHLRCVTNCAKRNTIMWRHTCLNDIEVM